MITWTIRGRAIATGVTAVALALTAGGGVATADDTDRRPSHASSPQLEDLDRGIVAAVTANGVFLSWRLLGEEMTGHGEQGVTGSAFRVYRGRTLIATVTDSTNYLDAAGDGSASYRVAAVVKGREQRPSDAVTPWSQNYHDLRLRKPAGGTTPSGEAYTYSANDMSVGDVDGDGSYEYVVKWDPSNSKDVSQVGYTGPVYIDTYRADGALLHRIDLGVNIRAGAHYTQFMVYDFDGNGRSEMMLKTAPGTKIIRYDRRGRVISERYITMPKADRKAGYSHDDDYRLSAAGYYQHLVEMFLGWHAHPEVTAGNWPVTLEEAFGIAPRYDYPLSRMDAEALADHFIDAYAPARSARNNLRAFAGFIVNGPEYLTVFDGATGRERQTIHYKPGRGDDGRDGTDLEFGRLTTKGFHSLSASDVDGDGKHEIVYGAATIDHDGSLLYCSFDILPPGSAAPGKLARLGHGDAMHVTDIDPARPGLEIYTVHEGATSAPYGYALRDARTGELLYGAYSGRDAGRGMVGDIVPDEPGLETWSIGMRTADGDPLGTGTTIPGTNQSIRWSADLTTQIVNGSGETTPTIDDWQRGRVLTATDTRANNGTKGNPSLVAGVLGDWREELLVRTADSTAIRIYLSTEVTTHKLYTLMHDVQYRAEVARQNTTYNQPSYPSFYLGSDVDWSRVPRPQR